MRSDLSYENDVSTIQDMDQDWNMMDLDCDAPNSLESLEDAAARAKAHMPISARMGLPASQSRSSVASLVSTSSCGTNCDEDEPSLSRSPESTKSTFPLTPARGEFVRRLPSEQGHDHSFKGIAEDPVWGFNGRQSITSSIPDNQQQSSNTQCSPRTTFPPVGHRQESTPSRTSLGQSLGLSIKPKVQSSHVPTYESPLSQARRNVDDSQNRTSFNITPSNLAARRKLPQLAIRGSIGADNAKSTMPHTPGGSVFAGARDGAATGSQTPVSPFVPPTPFVANHPAQGAVASPSPLLFNGQKRGSLPDVFSPLSRSPMHRQGSLGLMSPLSKDFASVSVHSTPSSSEAGYGSQDTVSSASTSLTTPEVSPLVAAAKLTEEGLDYGTPLSRQSSAGSLGGKKRAKDSISSESALGASRPKLSKSKSANRASPYPTREGSLGSPKTPRKNDSQLKSSSIQPPALLTPPTMEKSLSAPVPASPQTVSAKHLCDRTLHPDFASNYTIADELGSGGFGFVVSATRNIDQRPVAVKFIWKSKVPTHGWVRDPNLGVIPLEAFVLRVVDHPCVVKFIDLFDDDEFFYLVMEMHGTPWQAPEAPEKKQAQPIGKESKSASALVPESPKVAVFAPDGTNTTDSAMAAPSIEGGACQMTDSPERVCLTPPRPAPMERRTSHDLFECIEQHTRFSEDVAAWVFAQIVEAVYYLAKLGICHRDIKDENCVIDSDWNVKLIDFGSAVISDPRKPAPFFNRFFGTMTFASSEILKGQQYRAPHAEVWSLGVLLSILLSGECPFSDPDAALTGRISSRIRNSWSAEALNLLSGCVHTNPDKRATIAQVREHPWVRRAWESRGLRRPSAPRLFENSSSTAER
ncbi:unnamed protein product [Sympodiomycopsis kandeliae]